MTAAGSERDGDDLRPLEAQVSVEATPEQVMECLTSDQRWPRWWQLGWSGCALTSCRIDARVGGTFRVDSRTRRGHEHVYAGQVLYMTEDALITSWESDLCTGPTTKVLWSVTPAEGDTTTVSIEQRGLVGELQRARWSRGWQLLLQTMADGVPLLVGHPEAVVRSFRADQ